MNERRKGDRRSQSITVGQERRRSARRLQNDRRRQVRLPVELWMEEISGEDIYFRHSGNISAGGVFFENALPYPIGTILTLRFTIPDVMMDVVAKVEVTFLSSEGRGMGARFVSFDGGGNEALQQYLQRIYGDAGDDAAGREG